MKKEIFEQSGLKGSLEGIVRSLDAGRKAEKDPLDISFSEYIGERFNGMTMTDFLNEKMGINPNVDTISNIVTTGDLDARWIIPEIFREALTLGLSKSPIWSNIIAEESQVSQLKAIMPYINRSDATPRRVGEAETIPTGRISYGKKEIEIYKVGRGIKIPYEVMQYATLDVVRIFLEDFGKQLGLALDTLALDTLINGDQPSGSNSAPLIGVTTANARVYKDYLRLWIRMSRLGRNANVIIGGEDAALETLDLAEFKTNNDGGRAPAGVPSTTALDMKTPLPSSAAYYIHGNVPANKELILDPGAALLKFNAQPLLVESEKIVSNQTEAFYATLTTGFGKIFDDASVLLDKTDTIANLPFPSYMNVDTFENVVIE